MTSDHVFYPDREFVPVLGCRCYICEIARTVSRKAAGPCIVRVPLGTVAVGRCKVTVTGAWPYLSPQIESQAWFASEERVKR